MPWSPFKAFSIIPFTSHHGPMAIQGGGPEVLAIPLLIYPSPKYSGYALQCLKTLCPPLHSTTAAK